jgi:sugar-specific transcriptional regulator TrmB
MQSKLTNLQDSSQAFNHCGLGGFGLEGVEVLVGLGLTGRQARVYLALLKTGGGKAKPIAALSHVNRQEVYRLIDSLQELGLVQRNVTLPTTFTATPISEGVKLLLQHKTSELSVMCQKAKTLAKKLSQTPTPTPLAIAAKPCLGTVFEGDRGRKYCSAIKEVQHTIEVVITWSRFKQLTTHFETQFQNALKKGVTIHIVTEKPPNHHLPKWINTAISKKNSFKLKIQPNSPDASISIFDHTQTAIAFNPDASLTKGPDLWTNSPTLIALSQTYFNTIWTQTKPKEKQ